MGRRIALACVALLAIGSSALAQTKIKVASLRSMGSAAMLIAVEKGYYKAIGLDVEVVNIQSASNIMAPLATGEVQIVEGGMSVGFFNGLEKNLPFIMIYDLVSTPLGHKFIVRNALKGKVNKLADLKGLKVGVNSLSSVTAYELGKSLEAVGLTIKDVDTRVLGFPQSPPALVNGALDATLIVQPWATTLQLDGIGFELADPDDFVKPSPISLGGGFVNTEWAAKNKAALSDYMTATLRAVREYCIAYHGGPNRAEMVEAAVRAKLGTPDSVEKTMWPGRNISGEVNMPSILDMQEWFRREGFLKQSFPADRIYTNEYVVVANTRLGAVPQVNPESKLRGCR
jgi:NitT/TauT family transport system substrate-binding protein